MGGFQGGTGGQTRAEESGEVRNVYYLEQKEWRFGTGASRAGAVTG